MRKFFICIIAMMLVVFSYRAMAQAAQSSAIQNNARSLQLTLISQSPNPGMAGQPVDLTFMVENLGGKDINSLNLEFIPNYPFYRLPGENYVKSVSTLAGYQQGSNAIIVKFRVGVDKDAVQGTNSVTIRESMPQLTYDEKFDVDITGQKFAQIIFIDTSKLSPGSETPIKFTITNTGSSALQNLVFSWTESDGAILPVYSDNTRYVKYLDVNQSIELPYTVVANINSAPGLYPLNLDLKYQTDNGTPGVITTKAGITIGGATDFDVAFSESSQGQTSLSVANIGNNPAYSVTVSIPQQENYRVSGTQSSILGNLDKGDYTLASFQLVASNSSSFRQSRNISGQYQQIRRDNLTRAGQGGNDLEVRIDYTDTTGARHTVLKSVPIQFRAATGAAGQTGAQFTRQRSGLPGLVILAVIVVAALAGGFIYMRSRKKAKHENRKSP